MSSKKELYVLKIKPYAESESSDSIVEFTEDEWELIVDVFARLIRNFKQTFPEVEFEPIEQQERYLIIKFKEDPDITETELDYHVETLCGHNLDNIIFFDDEEYAIRGNIILDDMEEINKGRKLSLETENTGTSSESDSESESESESEEPEQEKHVVSPTRTTKIKEQKLVVSPTKLKKVISPVKKTKVSASNAKANKILTSNANIKKITSPAPKKITSPAPKKITSPAMTKIKTQEKKTQEKKTQEKKTQEKKTKNPDLKNLELKPSKNESTLDRFNKIYEHFAV